MRRMLGGIRYRYILILALPLILVACNLPDRVVSVPTATPSGLTLEEMEAAVASTLKAEGTLTAAARPSDTPSPAEPSPTATDTAAVPTETPTEVPSCLVVASILNLRSGPGLVYDPPLQTMSAGTVLLPFAKNGDGSWLEVQLQGESTTGWVSASAQFISCNFDPSGLPLGQIPPTPTPTNTSTPAPTLTPTSTYTATPTNTPCPKFTNPTLSAVIANLNNDVSLAWGSSGGCGPFTGTITATYKGESDPFEIYDVGGQSGKLTKRPDVRCEGTFTIVYALTLQDASGNTVSTTTTVAVTWLC